MTQKYKIMLIVLSIFFLTSCSNEEDNKSDLRKMNLNGKIKSLSENSYDANEKFGEPSKINVSKYNETYLFNKSGNIIQKKTDGVVLPLTKYIYDDENKLIEKNIYESDGNLFQKIKFVHDDNFNVIEENHYDEQGNLETKILNKYDKSNKLIEILQYNKDEKTFQNIIVYDSNGNKIKDTRYDKKENKIVRDEFYKYDENNNVIFNIQILNISDNLKSHISSYMKYDSYNNIVLDNWADKINSLKNSIKYKYEYDSENNWIKKIEFNYDKPRKIIERNIEYY